MKTSLTVLTIACCALTVRCNQAQAGDVTWTSGSLPTAQGWTYWPFRDDGLPDLTESQVFSINPDGTLHQDSLAAGFQGRGSNLYRYSGPELSGEYFSIDIRARVTQYDLNPGYPPEVNNPFGFGFGIGGPNGYAAAAITTGYVCTYEPVGWATHAVVFTGDNTGYHDYRLTGSLAPGGTYSLYRDGVYLGSAPLWTEPLYETNRIDLGDGTGGGNAVVDIASYSCVTVPEPATLLLFSFGGLALLRRRRA